MKKIIITLLSVLLVLSLAGCSKKEETKGPEVSDCVSKAFSDMPNSFYMLSFTYDIKEDSNLNYEEYYCGRLYGDEELNFGFITCTSLVMQDDGSFKFAIDDREYETDYDFDDYFKVIAHDPSSKDVSYKYCLGYGPVKDVADRSDDYWDQIVLHFDKYESEGIIYAEFDSASSIDDMPVNYTERITFTRFNSLQEAYDMCKQLDTRNGYTD